MSKFKEGDIVAFPGADIFIGVGSSAHEVYKIESVEPCGHSGLYRCAMWSFPDRRWVPCTADGMRGYDGRAMFFWESMLEEHLEAVNKLSWLVRFGIG